ncbi:uncharacterized protein LOC117638909 [Thrips palmi]|uniref:Uncharacterized protein LOC117638909 n=1 Tax=Thrips palmi TaxID=161013 RepID=A0A6P8XSX7_THRPL|nr:uncharacterized protein LOC117638909 [Thrips palmi]
MGCVSSKRNINSLHPNIYEVVNVDDDGNKISDGLLEVTDTELIHRQKNKPAIVWPLKSLRRYGADSQLFSFESGRRAPTGEGIYAFRCQRAEELFNHLQAHFTAEENATSNVLARTPDSTEPSGYLEPTHPRNVVIRQRQWNSNGRMDSINSCGPVSPPPVSPSPTSSVPVPSTPATPGSEIVPSPGDAISLVPEEPEEPDRTLCDDSNNNQHHPYLNYEIIEVVQLNKYEAASEPAPPSYPVAPSYMNVEIANSGDVSSSFGSEALPNSACNGDGYDSTGEVLRDHLYMNVVPGYENVASVPAENRVPPEGVSIIAKPVSGVALPYLPSSQSLTCGPLLRGKAIAKLLIGQDSEDDGYPSYSNLSPSEREGLGLYPFKNTATVNYAVLDLNQPPSSPAISLTPTGTHPDSPHGISSRGYATIDFNKTEALSHSVNPNLMDVDHEGCRKTRHNSTISDLPTPID